MYQTNVATEAEHRHATYDGPVAATGAAGVGRTGPRTTAGAVVMAAVPVVVTVVAAFPVVTMAAVAAFVAGRTVTGDEPDQREPRQTGPPTRQDHTGAPAD